MSARRAALGLAANPFVADPEPGVAPDLWISRAGVHPPPPPGQRLLVQLMWRRPPVAPLV